MGAATSVRSIVRRPIAWAAVAAVLVAAVATSAWLTRNEGADIDTTDFVTGNVRLWTFFETEPVQLTLGYEPVGDVLAPRAWHRDRHPHGRGQVLPARLQDHDHRRPPGRLCRRDRSL